MVTDRSLSLHREIKHFDAGWGANGSGQLGVGDLSSRGSLPAHMGDGLPEVNLGAGFVASGVSCGLDHSCAWNGEGKVKCWGGNAYGQVGGVERMEWNELECEMDGESGGGGELLLGVQRSGKPIKLCVSRLLALAGFGQLAIVFFFFLRHHLQQE